MTLSASADTFSVWLLAIEDAIRVCHVRSLTDGRSRTHAAVQWYQQQYDKYEDAMNTIEFGGTFFLHHVTGESVSESESEGEGPEREDRDTDTVRVWLQAEEEDTGLVFFPAGEEGSPHAPLAHRKKSVSNAERLVDRSGRRSTPERGSRPGIGTNSSGTSGSSFLRDMQGGFTLPFHLILGVSKGATEPVRKASANR